MATINGAIAGLAGITPASGFVSVEHSFVIGIEIGVISYSGVVLFEDKLKIEDAGLDISEHAESAYSEEEEFKLDMDTYTDNLRDNDEILRRKK